MKIEMGSNRSFGIIFSIIFIIISYFIFEKNIKLFFVILIFSMSFLILGITNSRYLTPLNKIWFQFGIILGKLISPFIMLVIYIVVFTPTGILLKMFRKDILNLRLHNEKSYWQDVNNKKSDMRNQF